VSAEAQIETDIATTMPALDLPLRGEDHSVPIAELSFQGEMGRISRQSGIVFAGTIFSAGLGYFFKIYLARVLGPDALGIYALGMTIVGFFGLFNVLGLPDSAVRFVASYTAAARVEELRSFLWGGAGIILAGNLICAGILIKIGPWIAARWYHAPELSRYVPLFSLILISGALISFFGKVVAGYKEVGRGAVITKLAGGPLTMAFSILLISFGMGLWGFLCAQIVSAAIVLALILAFAWRLTPRAARRPDFHRMSVEPEVWSFSGAVLGIGLLDFFVMHSDRIALGFSRTLHDVGIYSVAAGLVAYEPMILQSINQIFAPVISDVHTRGQFKLLKRLFQSLTKWTLGLTWPLIVVVVAYARPIMRIFGPSFEPAWPVLVVGSMGELVNCAVGSVGYLLLMSGNQRRLVRVQGAMAVVTVVLCAGLVPRWGIMGAAVATAIANVGMNLWNLVEVRCSLKMMPFNRSYLKLIPAAACSTAVAWLFGLVPSSLRSDWAVLGATLVACYAAFLAAAGCFGLDADDRLVASAAWGRLKGAMR